MNPQNAKVFGLVALGDLLLGLVLALLGVARDVLVQSIAGTALLLSGAGVLLWVMRTRDKPTAR